MTQLGLGCVALGSAGGRRAIDDIRLVQAAVDLGVRVFDTADVYGSGASEHLLGRALRGRRDDVVIATKGGFVFRERRPAEQWARRWVKPLVARARARRSTARVASVGSGSYSHQDFSSRHLRDAVHASLRRLGTDRIDVYQLHAPATVVPDVIDQLADLVATGDVVRFGVGASSVDEADGWIGVEGVRVVQMPFGLLDPEAASTTLPLARRHGCEVWVRGVLGGGTLSLAARDSAALVGHPRQSHVDAIVRLADKADMDLYQLAMGFVRAHADQISTVLVGTTSIEHLRHNLAVLADPPLAADVLQAISVINTSSAENR